MGKLVVADPQTGANRRPRSLGMWAVLTGVLTSEQLQEAYAEWEERGEAPGETFVRRGWMTEQMVADALGELSGLEVVKGAQRSDDPEVLSALSADEVWRLEACPLERDGDGNLVVAVADPSDARLRALREDLGAVHPVIVTHSELKALLAAAREAPSRSDTAASNGSAPAAEEADEADIEEHEEAPHPRADAEGPEDAPEGDDTATATLEPGDDPEAEADDAVEAEAEEAVEAEAEDPAAAEQLERLHERLVSEHVQSSDELVSHRRQVTELIEEQARVERQAAELAEEQARVERQAAELAEEQARVERQAAEIVDEQARIQRSITALEAKLEEEELVLSLIKAKLTAQ